MVDGSGNWDRARIKSSVAVASIHLLIGYLLVAGLGFDPASPRSDPLKLFEVVQPPPPLPPPLPPPPEVPRKAPSEAPREAAAPPALKAEASPVAAPEPEIRLELPRIVTVAPVAALGSDTSLGAAPFDGPGTGSGGEGSGTGGGGQGAGSAGGNGGGPPVRTRRIRGSITSSDYPRAAAAVGAEGTVVARLTVGARGRVTDCRIRGSSGNEALDTTTCKLILKRFRFQPARDERGRAVSDTVEWEQIWSRKPEDDPEVAAAMCRAQADKVPKPAARRGAFMSCMAALGWRR